MSTVIFDQDFVDELFACPRGVLEKMGVKPTKELLQAIEDLKELNADSDVMERFAAWEPEKNSAGVVELIFP